MDLVIVYIFSPRLILSHIFIGEMFRGGNIPPEFCMVLRREGCILNTIIFCLVVSMQKKISEYQSGT